jgi:hypothetical protein
MATNNLIPLFLSDHTEEPEQPVIGKAWHRAAISSRILKTSILVVTAAAIVFAVLSKGNPLVRFTNATASLVATSAPQDGAGQSMPIGQSTADVQALPPTASEAPLTLPIRVRPKILSQQPTACSRNTRLGLPRKMHGHRPGPCKRRRGLCKMRVQRSGPREMPEQKSRKMPERRCGASKMYGYRSAPSKIHKHRSSPCKMLSHRGSCKVSV